MANKDFKVKNGLDVSTPIPVSMGGTGQTSSENTLNALLPLQTDNANKFLQTDGTSTSWVAAAVVNNATFTGSSLVVPSGTNAERPASPVVGAVRLNTDQGTLEFWTGTSWGAIATFPQPPRNLVATDIGTSRSYDNGSMTVSFDTPIGNGGSTVTSYKIYSNPGSFVQTVNVPSTTATFTGLSSNTNYTFTGTSINSIGEGGASTESSAVLSTTLPSAPTIGTATAPNGVAYGSSLTASLTFTAGNTGGKTITNYKYSTDGTNYTAFSPAQTSSPLTIPGLTAGQSYTFILKAVNGNGDSLASSASSSILSATVPQAPTIGTPVANGLSGQVSIPFTANATGGSSITGFTVTSSGGQTATGSSSPIVITGLTNETAYTFTVTATNAKGTSLPSATSGSATPYLATPTVEYLIIGGGGAGGAGAQSAGGGAGQMLSASGYAVSINSPYTVTIGSSQTNSTFATITANKGSNGGSTAGTGGSSGNGYAGGAGGTWSDWSGAVSAGGGGGGASAAGGAASGYVAWGSFSSTGGNGGTGASNGITGSSVDYAGGGAGLGYSINGNASFGGGSAGGAGAVNTGGGGSGGGAGGGSGIFVLRYANTYANAKNTTGSPTFTNTGGYKIYKFTSSGSITF